MSVYTGNSKAGSGWRRPPVCLQNPRRKRAPLARRGRRPPFSPMASKSSSRTTRNLTYLQLIVNYDHCSSPDMLDLTKPCFLPPDQLWSFLVFFYYFLFLSSPITNNHSLPAPFINLLICLVYFVISLGFESGFRGMLSYSIYGMAFGGLLRILALFFAACLTRKETHTTTYSLVFVLSFFIFVRRRRPNHGVCFGWCCNGINSTFLQRSQLLRAMATRTKMNFKAVCLSVQASEE